MRVTTAILTTLATLGCSGGQTKDGDTDDTGETGDTGGPIEPGGTGCPSGCCEDPTWTVTLDEILAYSDGRIHRPGEAPSTGVAIDPTTDAGCRTACLMVHGQPLYETMTSSSISACSLMTTSESDAQQDSDWTIDSDGTVTPYHLQCTGTVTGVCEGRHHAVLSRTAQGRGATPLGAWLARAAAAEAGSVHAFRALASELAALGAPAALVDACLDAADDEVRHARDTAWLARRHGGEPAPTPRQPLPARSLRDVALENAIEGCVHETFAAAVAVWQAQHAADPDLRALAAAITPDELRHAELAHALHAWAVSALSPEDAHAVQVAQDRAWDRLICEGTAIDVADDVLDDLGWPDPPTAARLAMGIRARLAVG